MPKQRSPNRDKAYNLWMQSGGKLELKLVAEELGVSAEQVRKWKNQDKWDINLNGNVTIQKGKTNGNVTKRKGGQIGNKNAKGNGAPKGNKNNLRHGLYSLLNTNALSEEEQEAMLLAQDLDTIRELEEQVRLCDILVSRSLNEIARLKEGKEVTPTNISKRVTKVKGKTLGYTQEETEQSYVFVDEKIEKLNNTITKQIKIKGKLLKDIEDIKTTRNKYRLGEDEISQVTIIDNIRKEDHKDENTS